MTMSTDAHDVSALVAEVAELRGVIAACRHELAETNQRWDGHLAVCGELKGAVERIGVELAALEAVFRGGRQGVSHAIARHLGRIRRLPRNVGGGLV